MLAPVLALAACVASSRPGPNTTTASTSDGTKVICREEAPIGSTITRQVCRTPEQMEEDRKRADDMLRVTPSRPSNN